jgi:photoactive yellow protein
MNDNNSLHGALPFGLMQLDGGGKIVRYSPANEASPAVSPAHVIGRNFFADIAPVREVLEIKNRFLAYMVFGNSVQRLTLRFLHTGVVIKVQLVMARLASNGGIGDERTALVRLMPDGGLPGEALHGASAARHGHASTSS